MTLSPKDPTHSTQHTHALFTRLFILKTLHMGILSVLQRVPYARDISLSIIKECCFYQQKQQQ